MLQFIPNLIKQSVKKVKKRVQNKNLDKNEKKDTLKVEIMPEGTQKESLKISDIDSYVRLENKNLSNEIDSTDVTVKKSSLMKTVGKFALRRASLSLGALVYLVFAIGSQTAVAVDAADAAKDVIGAEGGKKALEEALKVARGKPALAVASSIVCLACVPVAGGVGASASMCVACGILIAKVLG